MKTQRFIKTFLIIITILLFSLTGCSEKESYHTIYLEEAFSIIPYVNIYESNSKFEHHSFDIKRDCNKVLKDLDDKFDVNKEDSMISIVNGKASEEEVEIDYEFYYLLTTALSASVNVSEKYDVTSYALSTVWDFKNQYYVNNNYGSIPQEESINEAKTNVDYTKVKVKEDNGRYTVKFEKEGIKIDLGSIVKGYACDKLEEVLKQNNVNIGIINIGGNIITFGNKEINVGITTPFNDLLNTNCNIIGIISAINDSYTFVTTGTYERYIKTSDGKMYHHIIDKETGYPIDNDLLSVTIISNDSGYKSMNADVLSTAIFTLGLDKGLEYVKNNKIEAVFITKEKKIILTEEIKELFDYNELLNEYGYMVE